MAGFGVMPQTLNPYVYGLNNPLRFVDAGGAFPPLVAAMLVGAAIGAVVAAGEYYLTHDKGSFDWGEFWFAAGTGAVVGAVEEVVFLGMGKFFRAARIGSRVTPSLGQAFGRGGRYVDDAAWVGANACANSFSADTPVATETGQCPISEVALGERVLAWDEATGSLGYYPVTDLIRHEDPEVYHLSIEDGAGGVEDLVTTREHPFYTVERGWVPAGDLWNGARLRRADGSDGVVRAVWVVQDPQRMYNLTVEGPHTFFVGDGQWLVHNAVCRHQHHLFPQKWRDWFAGGGRNIDIDQHTVWLDETTHLSGVHGKGGPFQPRVQDPVSNMPGKWNDYWEAFIKAKPNATAQEVHDFANGLRKRFGLENLPTVPYNR